MLSEFTLDLCFIREHAESPFDARIEQLLEALFAGKGTWYIDSRVEEGLDIAVAEVKGMASWQNEDELLHYIEESAASDPASGSDCWDSLQGYQVKVTPKEDAGCCSLKKEATA
ncbi:hypothetical protein [Paenibacillus sp. SI8]|uniref:hypothetical protein n=1 Tax=unclassified Paenibacillus TaxID=185978 RepID=UPI00346777AF